MIVLDTHAWIWWVSNPEFLSEKAKQVIDEAVTDRNVLISTISTWEVISLSRAVG